ncbi:hypothetical protein [Burkholderia sp. Bp8963]|uniref:hypothetical protein n=1 Tax=Burkholderia sp. Bp8963 TaxID=2184547 RepID=UPI000F59A8E9|nr:hypothetical protein [Burkholderia sp. Bp8963]
MRLERGERILVKRHDHRGCVAAGLKADLQHACRVIFDMKRHCMRVELVADRFANFAHEA